MPTEMRQLSGCFLAKYEHQIQMNGNCHKNNPLYDARVIFGQAGGFLEDLRQHQEERCQEQ